MSIHQTMIMMAKGGPSPITSSEYEFNPKAEKNFAKESEELIT